MASQGQAALSALGVGWGVLSSLSGTKPATPPPTASTSKESQKAKSSPSSLAVLPSSSNTPSASSGSSWLLPSLGALTVAGVAAAGMYYKKDLSNHVTSHVTWTTDHLSFLVELWNTEALDKRMKGIERAKEDGIGFAWFVSILLRPFVLSLTSFLIVSTLCSHHSPLRPAQHRREHSSSSLPRPVQNRTSPRIPTREQRTRFKLMSICLRTRMMAFIVSVGRRYCSLGNG